MSCKPDPRNHQQLLAGQELLERQRVVAAFSEKSWREAWRCHRSHFVSYMGQFGAAPAPEQDERVRMKGKAAQRIASEKVSDGGRNG